MICTNRIYKGETFEVSIPFMVEGWSDLYVEYFTNGQYKVTRTADELIIDEYTITAEFSGNDLDLLADGVLRYTLYYTLEGVAYTKSTNTPYYLKTPAAYSAMTPTDYYHEGEVVGKAEGYLSGYTQGYEQGLQECSGDSCTLEESVVNLPSNWDRTPIVVTPTTADGLSSVVVQDGAGGYGDTRYDQGFADGQATCSGGSCNLEDGELILEQNWTGYTMLYPSQGKDGFGRVQIADVGYGESKFNEGLQSASANLQTKYIKLTANTQTITAPNGTRPTPVSDTYVTYGGDYEQFVNLVSGNTNSELLIRWWNAQHILNFVLGRFCFENGSLAFRPQGSLIYGTTLIDDIYDEWTPVTDITSVNGVWVYNDRSNIYVCVKSTTGWFFEGFEKEELLLPTKPIIGYNEIHVSGTCQLTDYTYMLDGGWSGGLTTITPVSGFGFSSVTIGDDGYGDAMKMQGVIEAQDGGARYYSLHGEITFSQDFTFDQNANALVILSNEYNSTSHAIEEAYITINYESVSELKNNQTTLSAGTYVFDAYPIECVMEHSDLDYFTIGEPSITYNGSDYSGVTFSSMRVMFNKFIV